MAGDGPVATSATSGHNDHRQPASLSPQPKDQYDATDVWHLASSWIHVFYIAFRIFLSASESPIVETT
jgi:hypothetical protein